MAAHALEAVPITCEDDETGMQIEPVPPRVTPAERRRRDRVEARPRTVEPVRPLEASTVASSATRLATALVLGAHLVGWPSRRRLKRTMTIRSERR